MEGTGINLETKAYLSSNSCWWASNLYYWNKGIFILPRATYLTLDLQSVRMFPPVYITIHFHGSETHPNIMFMFILSFLPTILSSKMAFMKTTTPFSRATFVTSKMHTLMIQLILMEFLLSSSVNHSLTNNDTNQHDIFSFKQAFIYDPYNKLQNWNTRISLCKWTGVECSSWN